MNPIDPADMTLKIEDAAERDVSVDEMCRLAHQCENIGSIPAFISWANRHAAEGLAHRHSAACGHPADCSCGGCVRRRNLEDETSEKAVKHMRDAISRALPQVTESEAEVAAEFELKVIRAARRSR